VKPDWKDAPEWANWLAMDDDGSWCWFEDIPHTREDFWLLRDGNSAYAFRPPPAQRPLGWRETLEPKPIDE
jgi:hypothetical protein